MRMDTDNNKLNDGTAWNNKKSLFSARRNMVEQQIRTWEVLDEAILALYNNDDLLRERFVDKEAQKDLAYADLMLPIDCGQVMLEPKLEARMLQELAPRSGETVLHIGTGSGFFAALLGQLAGQVISAEIFPELATAASNRLKRAGADNVQVINADAASGLAEHAPYDAVVLTGSVPHLASALLAQLKDTGRLLAIVGVPPIMSLRLFTKHSSKTVLHRDILETCIPALENAPSPSTFQF